MENKEMEENKMKKTRKILALLLALCLCLGLFAGCGGDDTPDADPTPSKSTGGAVGGEDSNVIDNNNENSGDVEDLDSFWPEEFLRDKIELAVSQGSSSLSVSGRVGWGNVVLCYFQQLATVDTAGNVHLQMLKSFEKVDDLTYKAELWPFITDTAGNNITVDDVIACYQYKIDSGNKGAVNRLAVDENNQCAGAGIEKTGDYTFIWHCSTPFDLGEMGKNLSNVDVWSWKAYEDSGDEFANQPVGTGAYMVKSWVSGSQINVVANPDFWMKKIEDKEWLTKNLYEINKQNVREIELQVVGDAANRAIALEMGTVVAVDRMNAADVNIYAADPSMGITPVSLPVTPPVTWYYNCNEISPCSDVNLRMAICYALDNAAIAEGLSVPAYPVYGVCPNGLDSPEEWRTGTEYYDYNIETAKDYLAKSGYKGETLVMMYNSGDSATADAVVLVQDMLKKINVTVELLPAEMSVMNDYKTDYTKWDMLFETMGGGSYFKNMMKRFTVKESGKTNNGNNVIGIIDDKLEGLFEACDKDSSLENIKAWNDYFTYEQCYAYALCGYYDMTGCLDSVNMVLVGAQNNLVPGAFTYND